MASTAPVSAPQPLDTDALEGSQPNYTVPLAIVTSLFFMWGGITALNDIIIPHLKSIFDLSNAKVMLVQTAFFSGYFIFAMPAGKLIEAIGYKWAMVCGLCVMAAGTLSFIPAAAVPSFSLFLTALFVLAAGMTILQVSANPYVSVLGPPRTASSRINLAQAFNSLGTTLFPLIGGLLILGEAASSDELKKMAADALHHYRVSQAGSVRLPYVVLTIALVVLAILISMARLPILAALQRPASDDAANAAAAAAKPSQKAAGDVLDYSPSQPVSIWHHRQLILGAVGIFMYVGAEVSIGSFIVNYLADPLSKGGLNLMTEKTASQYLPFYWGGAMVGRFIGSALLQKLNPAKLLAIFAVIAISLVATTMITNGSVAMYAVLAIGLFNSIMFPNIFALSIEGLGNLTSKGSSILIAAIVGGAIIPPVQGKIADIVGIHHGFILPMLCYAYITFFAIDRWHHAGRTPDPATASA